MGAEIFETISIGKNVKEAYEKAVERANYDYGHRGYTGEINVKNGYIELNREQLGDIPINIIVELISQQKESYFHSSLMKGIIEKFHQYYDDKWGPAVAIKLTDFEQEAYLKNKDKQIISQDKGIWLFCGWASS